MRQTWHEDGPFKHLQDGDVVRVADKVGNPLIEFKIEQVRQFAVSGTSLGGAHAGRDSAPLLRPDGTIHRQDVARGQVRLPARVRQVVGMHAVHLPGYSQGGDRQRGDRQRGDLGEGSSAVRQKVWTTQLYLLLSAAEIQRRNADDRQGEDSPGNHGAPGNASAWRQKTRSR